MKGLRLALPKNPGSPSRRTQLEGWVAPLRAALAAFCFSFLAKTAVERKCGRLERWGLDWNEPAIRF